jgi:hypothetical protein
MLLLVRIFGFVVTFADTVSKQVEDGLIGVAPHQHTLL